MRIEIAKNYLSADDCSYLTSLTNYGKDNNLMTLGINTSLRYTSRLHPDLYTYPQRVLDIAAQIRAYCGVANYPVVPNQGQNGIVTTYMPTGADIFSYQASLIEDQGQLWAYVITQQTESGGVTQLNGVNQDLGQGDLLCYLTSNNTQYVTPVTGATTRICWTFGNLVPTDAWESGQIVFGG